METLKFQTNRGAILIQVDKIEVSISGCGDIIHSDTSGTTLTYLYDMVVGAMARIDIDLIPEDNRFLIEDRVRCAKIAARARGKKDEHEEPLVGGDVPEL